MKKYDELPEEAKEICRKQVFGGIAGGKIMDLEKIRKVKLVVCVLQDGLERGLVKQYIHDGSGIVIDYESSEAAEEFLRFTWAVKFGGSGMIGGII